VARRFGCALLLLLLAFGAAGTALVWLVLSATGVVGSAPFVRLVSAVALLLGVAAVGVAATALRRVTARAGGLVDAAKRVEGGDYSARVPVRGPSELRSLARAFNAMSGRLEAEEARRRSVLAEVAHELRTPLTVIRGQAEGIVDGVYPGDAERMRPILAAANAIEVLIDDLRTLALAETGSLRLRSEPVDVAILVNATLDAFRPAAAEAQVSLDERVSAATPMVDGDPVRLRGVLDNLVSNALRHTGAGGHVRVLAEPGEAGTVRIAVSDDGEGIAPDLLPRVFDRFVKGPTSTGSGLGLAIVRDVVEAHGGAVVANSEPGRGATIEVTLPRAR